MNKKCIEKILEAAVRAPSGDNVQPWDIRVSENFTRIDVYNLPEKDNSYYNYQQAASYIAHGALLENILIAAKHLGCHTKYQLFPDSNNENHVMRISLSTAEAQRDPLYPAIFKRCTNRFQYKRTEVTEKALNALSHSVKSINTAKVSLVYDQGEINLLAKEFMVNDQLVFERKDIHAFFFDKIRWNQKQIEETEDGMPVSVLGLNSIEKMTFPLLKFWWYVRMANIFGLSNIIRLKCWWNCRNVSLLGMISIQGRNKSDFVQGGRAVQRLWLEATAQGFSIQPIIGLTLLINRFQQNALDEFSCRHKKIVSRAAKEIPELFDIKSSETLIMGFRMGGSNLKITQTMRKRFFVF